MLKRLLAWLGINVTSCGQCATRALEMDRRGIAWCRENLETIVGWLGEETERRRKRHAEQLAVYRAARGEQGRTDPLAPPPAPLPWLLRLPFSDVVGRRLVALAIRLAEKREPRSTARAVLKHPADKPAASERHGDK
jgi:hypothetical protein